MKRISLCLLLAAVALSALSPIAHAAPDPALAVPSSQAARAAGIVSAVGAVNIDPALVIAPTPQMAPQEQDALALLNLIVSAARGRNWALLGALVLSLLVWAVRKFASRVAVAFAGKLLGRAAAWLTTDRGGALLALLAGIASALAVAFASGFSWGLLLDGVVAGVTAAGGYAVVRKLCFPSGKDAAQAVAANAAAVGAAASAGPGAAAEQINRAIGRG